MDYFSHQRKSLQRSRPEFFEQQEFGEIMELPFVGNGQNRSEPFQVDVVCANLVMRWKVQSISFLQSRDGILSDDFNHRQLGGPGCMVDQIHDFAGVFADDSAVRLVREIADSCRMPVVASSRSARVVETL